MVNEEDIQAIKKLLENFDSSHSSVDLEKLKAALNQYSSKSGKSSNEEKINEFLKKLKEKPSVVKSNKSSAAPKQETQAKEPQFSYTPSSFGLAVLQRAKADLAMPVIETRENDGVRIAEYFRNFNSESGQPWCAAAVSTWMKEAGGGPVRGGLGALNIGRQFKDAGRWVDKKNIKPEHLSPGNIVVWTRPAGGAGAGHIGVISSSNGSSFTSIEGNSGPQGNKVHENPHSINDDKLVGIGILSDIKPKSAYKKTEQLIKLAARYQLKYN